MWAFLLKNWKWVVMVLLAGALAFFVWRADVNAKKYQREVNNVEALAADLKVSETKRGEAVATVQELQYTVEEFKQRQAADAELIRELHIRASEVREIVKTVVKTEVVYRDTMHRIEPLQKLEWARDTKWWGVKQTIDLAQNPPVTDFNLSVRDSLTHILYKVPKCRFLGIRWGVKCYEIKVINHNPNSTVTYARWINVTKEKGRRERE